MKATKATDGPQYNGLHARETPKEALDPHGSLEWFIRRCIYFPSFQINFVAIVWINPSLV